MRGATCSFLIPLLRMALLSSFSGVSGSLGGPPHLVFILVDDQGYADVGYHGSEIRTPVLDRLAGEGVRLENYYVQPICSPSRSQLMTGRYQIHTGLQHSVIRPLQPLCLPAGDPTLPERLGEAGYVTHMVGKWHLGFCRRGCLPTRRGFHSFLGTLTGGGDHFSYQSCAGEGEACGFDLHDGERPAWELAGNYSTTLYVQRVKEILRGHDPSRPLFLYLSLQAAHLPLQAPQRFLQAYPHMENPARRRYAAMLSCLDQGLGEVVQELQRTGLYQDTVLVYSSDNGAQPLSGGSNWPLRGGKGTYWEGGVRAVGFVHSPLLKRKGAVSRALIHVSDWYPTLLGLAGVSGQQGGRLDGRDVWGAISEGLPSPRTEILFNIDPVSKRPGAPGQEAPGQEAPGQEAPGQEVPGQEAPGQGAPGQEAPRQEAPVMLQGLGVWDTAVRAAIRVGEWKLLTGNMGDGDWVPPQRRRPPPALERWQALEKRRDQRRKSVWLFNITGDPNERADLTEARPEVVRRLLARLGAYNLTAVEPRNPPDDPMADPQLHGGAWGPWLGLEGPGAGREEEARRVERKVRVKHCKVCKLKALFKKVGSRLQRNSLLF